MEAREHGRDRPAGSANLIPEIDRISTGNVEADEVLGGGYPKQSINVIMGRPGTGKTIFAEQLAFNNAGGDRPILYMSTLSEPMSKLVRYLQSFRFFDEEKIGTAVVYEDVGPELAAEGVEALSSRLDAAIKAMSPKIIVIDSFRAVHDMAASVQPMRAFVYELAGLLTAYDTTAFLLGEYSESDIQRYPEFAIADSVVEFSRRPLGTRDERYFRVLKLRGSGYAEGSHAVRISDQGIHIFPRLVTPEMAEAYEHVLTRISTGVPGLDEMLGGGVWKGSSTLLTGPSGSGKTTIALQFAGAGAERNEPVLFLNFQENPTQLARSIRGLGMEPERLEAAGLQLMYTSPVELQIDTIIVELFRRVRGAGMQRVIVDAVGDLAASASDTQRLHDYLYSLIQHLAARNVTSILTFETLGHSVTGTGLSQGPISYMCDNLILLELEGAERTRRTVRVMKTRASAHDTRVRILDITGNGAQVA